MPYLPIFATFAPYIRTSPRKGRTRVLSDIYPKATPTVRGTERRGGGQGYGRGVHVMDGRAMKDPTKITFLGIGKKGLPLLTKGVAWKRKLPGNPLNR